MATSLRMFVCLVGICETQDRGRAEDIMKESLAFNVFQAFKPILHVLVIRNAHYSDAILPGLIQSSVDGIQLSNTLPPPLLKLRPNGMYVPVVGIESGAEGADGRSSG